MYDNGLLNIAKQIESSVNEVARASAAVVCEKAKSLCTDEEVKDSIIVNHDGNSWEVCADNAVPIEFGTAYTSPKPFLAPSLIAEKNNIVTAMADTIEEMGAT